MKEHLFSHLHKFPRPVRRSSETVNEDTGTEKTYAEHTWSDGQILCDSLQNNLDAQTRAFVAELERRHVVNREEAVARAEESPAWGKQYLDMLNLLYVLSYRAEDLESGEKEKLVQRIRAEAEKLQVVLTNVDVDTFAKSERPQLPTLTYAVRDTTTGKIIRNIRREDLCSGQYADVERYPLFEWRVQDMGSGYDAIKTVLYLPTKGEEKFSRGIFGEGIKVNQAAIARTPGVALRMHSAYVSDKNETTAWVRHVSTDEDLVMHKGRTVRSSDMQTGSGMTIRFHTNEPRNKDLRTILDPRSTPVESVAAEFGSRLHTYPLGVRTDGVVYPGISLTKTSQQYLQGLRIGNGREDLLFSYDFQNRDIIAGRDRKNIKNDVMKNVVASFWNSVHNKDLLDAFAQRLLWESSTKFNSPERDVFLQACERSYIGDGSGFNRALLERCVHSFSLDPKKKNCIVCAGERAPQQVDTDKVNVISLELSCSRLEKIALMGMLARYAPHVTCIESEAIQTKTETKKENLSFKDFEIEFFDSVEALFDEVKNEMRPFMVHDSGSRPSWWIRKGMERGRTPYKELEFGIVRDRAASIITCKIPGDGGDVSKVPDMKNPEVRRAIKARLCMVYITAQYDSRENSTTYVRCMESAQNGAQHMLDISPPKTFSVPGLQGLRQRAEVRMREQMKGWMGRREVAEHEMTLNALHTECVSLSCTPDQLLENAQWCFAMKGKIEGVEYVLEVMYGRVLVHDGVASYLRPRDDTTVTPELVTVPLTEKNKVGEWSGYSEYDVGNNRYVTLVPTYEHSTLSQRHSFMQKLQSICGDFSVRIKKGRDRYEDIVENTAQSYENVQLGDGCIVSRMSLSGLKDPDLYTYHPRLLRRDANEKPVRNGTVLSPVTLEYISAHWSDSVTIFKDLGQNHQDAGGFKERFQIERNGERVWVTQEHLGDSEILGYALSDTGLGYSPHGIHNMGHTRKRNPFLTGKNGEGLKLAAASAKKHGFDISFASTGFDDAGNTVSWQADAIVKEQQYMHDARRRTAHRLGFAIRTVSDAVLEGASAVTKISVPQDASLASREQWKQWAEAIDPRKRDTFGNGGISRYIITEDSAQGAHDTAGPVTAFFERPGKIFENGICVRDRVGGSDSGRKYTFGWRFPSVTNTRERTHIDEDMVQKYVQYYFANTTSERAIESMLKNVDPSVIEKGPHGNLFRGFSRVSSLANTDIEPEWALPSDTLYPSLGLFRKVAQRMYPGMTLFSRLYAEQYGIPLDGSLQHIPDSRRLYVNAEDYEKLRHIFPNMQTYMSDVRKSKIDMDAQSLEPLRNMVGQHVTWVGDAIRRIEKSAFGREMLTHALEKSGTSREVFFTRLDNLRPEVVAGTLNDVFIMSEDSSADGVASLGIGLRLPLIGNTSFGEGRVYGTVIHEIVHKVLGAKDYTDEFVLLLMLLARDARMAPRNKEKQSGGADKHSTAKRGHSTRGNGKHQKKGKQSRHAFFK